MEQPPFEFWYDFASPYSYMATERLDKVLAVDFCRVAWNPLLLGPILTKKNSNSSPYQQSTPAEARYRRRDVERNCALHRIPLVWPSSYPRASILAARIAFMAVSEGWCPTFSKMVFRANFAEDRDIAKADVIGALLEFIGRDPDFEIGRATSYRAKADFRAHADAASERGIFGVPSFVVGGELFWGNDRLEQAVGWLQKSAVEK